LKYVNPHIRCNIAHRKATVLLSMAASQPANLVDDLESDTCSIPHLRFGDGRSLGSF